MASSARHLFLLALVATLAAIATPRAAAWGGGRFFFSKTTRPGTAVVDEPPERVMAAGGTNNAVVVPAAADVGDPNSASTVFSRPSTGGSSGRGFGLYGRPEESFPPEYFRRGVHRNAEKLTATINVPSATTADEAVPVGGRGERAAPSSAEDNGSGRGRAPWKYTYTNVPTTSTEETVVEDNGSGRGRAPWKYAYTNVPTTSAEETTVPAVSAEREPFEEDNGSGWGRPRRYHGADADGRPEEQPQRLDYYGMSDTRLYQNGRYYYDVEAGRYGYGRESNPVRTTRPEEFAGGERRGRYYYGNQYGSDNGVMNSDFQEEAHKNDGRYLP